MSQRPAGDTNSNGFFPPKLRVQIRSKLLLHYLSKNLSESHLKGMSISLVQTLEIYLSCERHLVNLIIMRYDDVNLIWVDGGTVELQLK